MNYQEFQSAPVSAVTGYWYPGIGRSFSPLSEEEQVIARRHQASRNACEASRRQQAERKISFQPRRG